MKTDLGKHWHDRRSVFTSALEGSKRIRVDVTLGQRAEQRMKLRGWMVTLSMMCLSIPVAVAQSGMPAPTNDVRLGNIMNSVQLWHLKTVGRGQGAQLGARGL